MEIVMPSIIDILAPAPAALEQPFTIDISLCVEALGPHLFCFELDRTIPYFFTKGTEHVKRICRRRSFGTTGSHTSHFSLGMARIGPPVDELPLIVTISGLDGTSPPFTTMLPLHP
jgi:hypothetical protein